MTAVLALMAETTFLGNGAVKLILVEPRKHISFVVVVRNIGGGLVVVGTEPL